MNMLMSKNECKIREYYSEISLYTTLAPY